MYYGSIPRWGTQIKIGMMGVWRGLVLGDDYHEMFVIHGQLRLAGQEALKAKHSQPPNHQLIKVVFRACPAKRKMLWHLAG